MAHYGDDKQFVEQLKAQDKQAFSTLVRRHHATLLTLARSIVGEALADEVVQEAWLLAYQALPRFEGKAKVTTWLFTIVSNHAKTRLRKENRTQSLDALEETQGQALAHRFAEDGHWATPVPQWHQDTPDGLLEQAQLQHCMEKTLERLPEMQKAVFMLKELEQLSLKEICNTLDVSESNVRVLLHRARVKFFEVIERYQETGRC